VTSCYPTESCWVPSRAGEQTILGNVPNDLMRDGLHQRLALRREDVFINLVEVTKENWSLGNSEASICDRSPMNFRST
jgi:Tautomerase enzyme